MPLIIVSGPSGVGKGTILGKVLEKSKWPLKLSVSATTRKPRQGEINGVHYWFLSPEEFERKKENGEFLEFFQVFGAGHWYGTLKTHVMQSLEEGNWVVLEIDVQGARQVKKAFPDAVTIFIAPETPDVLRERLIGRGTESSELMQDRLARAMEELRHKDEYDYCIINADLDRAVQEFCDILATL